VFTFHWVVPFQCRVQSLQNNSLVKVVGSRLVCSSWLVGWLVVVSLLTFNARYALHTRLGFSSINDKQGFLLILIFHFVRNSVGQLLQ